VSRQLPLGLRLSADATLDNFIAGDNEQALAAVRHAASGAGEHFITLWGAGGCGKSHLLQAACHSARSHNRSAFYLSLKDKGELDPQLLTGLETLQLICLDGIDDIAAEAAWEEALHHLYNGVRDHGGALIVASQSPIQEIPFALKDLKSRLGWGPSYHLRDLRDEDKSTALQQAANMRGLSLPADVAQYLLTRHTREMHQLMAIMDELDQASLAEQRKLTIPFLRAKLKTTR
jgi:DnaA family protein